MFYLIFNEGYPGTSGKALIREDLCTEAIRLERLLTDQDHDRMDRDLVAEGQELVRQWLTRLR